MTSLRKIKARTRRGMRRIARTNTYWATYTAKSNIINLRVTYNQDTRELSYQWFFNGDPIPGANTATLPITPDMVNPT